MKELRAHLQEIVIKIRNIHLKSPEYLHSAESIERNIRSILQGSNYRRFEDAFKSVKKGHMSLEEAIADCAFIAFSSYNGDTTGVNYISNVFFKSDDRYADELREFLFGKYAPKPKKLKQRWTYIEELEDICKKVVLKKNGNYSTRVKGDTQLYLIKTPFQNWDMMLWEEIQSFFPEYKDKYIVDNKINSKTIPLKIDGYSNLFDSIIRLKQTIKENPSNEKSLNEDIMLIINAGQKLIEELGSALEKINSIKGISQENRLSISYTMRYDLESIWRFQKEYGQNIASTSGFGEHSDFIKSILTESSLDELSRYYSMMNEFSEAEIFLPDFFHTFYMLDFQFINEKRKIWNPFSKKNYFKDLKDILLNSKSLFNDKSIFSYFSFAENLLEEKTKTQESILDSSIFNKGEIDSRIFEKIINANQEISPEAKELPKLYNDFKSCLRRLGEWNPLSTDNYVHIEESYEINSGAEGFIRFGLFINGTTKDVIPIVAKTPHKRSIEEYQSSIERMKYEAEIQSQNRHENIIFCHDIIFDNKREEWTSIMEYFPGVNFEWYIKSSLLCQDDEGIEGLIQYYKNKIGHILYRTLEDKQLTDFEKQDIIYESLKRVGKNTPSSVKQKHIPTWTRANKIIQGWTSGIAHYSKKGLIHRDIKPANLMIFENGEIIVKIADFGVATTDPNDPHRSCTPHYIYPEYLMTKPKPLTIEKTDMFSMALSMFYYISGVNPYISISRKAKKEGKNFYRAVFNSIKNKELNLSYYNPLAQSQLKEGINYLQNLFNRSLSLNPSERPEAKEFSEEFDYLSERYIFEKYGVDCPIIQDLDIIAKHNLRKRKDYIIRLISDMKLLDPKENRFIR